MPKRFCSNCSQSLCKRCCERLGFSKRKNLYLVLDDWIRGYNIRKMNLPSSSDGDGGAVQRLPPALLCMVAERGLPYFFTAAFGAKILMMLAVDTDTLAVPLIDVNELDATTLGPDTSYPCNPIYIPVGSDKLFVIDILVGPFQVCCLMPQPDAISPSLTRDHWVWKKLRKPPFKWSMDVSSYAVDTREQTIFVSSKGGNSDDATFIYDIGKNIWKHYGRWVLPFNGRGYYVRDMDGFVGMSTDPDTLGYLCICDMTETSAGEEGLCPYPDVKLSKVKVFNKNPAEHHVGATLTYRHHSKFCIVECVSLGTLKADQAPQEPEASSGSSYVYHVITFSIGYDKRADLKVRNYRVSCYDVPREATSGFKANPVAFWL